MHYLVTGHTGFKGAWLTLLLISRGHTVSGIALDPAPNSLFQLAGLGGLLESDVRLDIRNADRLSASIEQISPDVVIHLAAQPLVRESYRSPRETFETNAMGTLNILEATQTQPSIRARLIVTTDKVYRNVGQTQGYVESDALGGRDPYSASKAMADLLTQSWVASYPGPPTAIARAGNVIGGGDVSPDRLLPDLLRSFERGETARIRNPSAVRPWQHVLDCLNGYLLLIDELTSRGSQGEWNFGPGPESFVDVARLADLAASFFGKGASWEADVVEHPHEAAFLTLDATKAGSELGWCDKLGFEDAVQWTVEWHQTGRSEGNALQVSRDQIARFEGLPWSSRT